MGLYEQEAQLSQKDRAIGAMLHVIKIFY